MENKDINYFMTKWESWFERFEADFKNQVAKREAKYGCEEGEISVWDRYEERRCFTERVDHFLYLYKDDIPAEILNEFKNKIVQYTVQKLKEHSVKIDAGEMISMINIYPETIKDIDLVASSREGIFKNNYKDKDYVILEAIKNNPNIINLLSKKQLMEIAALYAKQYKGFNEMINTAEGSDYRTYGYPRENYEGGEPDFILQLVKINPGVLQTEIIQNMIRENPELEKRVTIYQLRQEKEQKTEELEQLEDELAKLQGRQNSYPEK